MSEELVRKYFFGGGSFTKIFLDLSNLRKFVYSVTMDKLSKVNKDTSHLPRFQSMHIITIIIIIII